jgi:hypothetical protein
VKLLKWILKLVKHWILSNQVKTELFISHSMILSDTV